MHEHATSATVDGPVAPVSAAAVARAAGVSSAAVSYVLNGKGGVSPETRRHIIHVANELGFRPRKPSQSTDPQRTRVIGLILPNIINPMFPRWAQGVITAAAESGYEVFVATTQDDPEVLAQVTSTLAHRNVDGIILAASLRDDATALRTLRAARIPYVCLSRRADFLDSDFVGIDDDAAATTLMQQCSATASPKSPPSSDPASPRPPWPANRRFCPHRRHGGHHDQRRPEDQHQSQQRGRPAGGGTAVLLGNAAAGRGVRQRRTCHRRHGIRLVARPAHPGRRRRRRLRRAAHSRSGLINLTSIVQPQQEMANEAFAMLLNASIPRPPPTPRRCAGTACISGGRAAARRRTSEAGRHTPARPRPEPDVHESRRHTRRDRRGRIPPACPLSARPNRSRIPPTDPRTPTHVSCIRTKEDAHTAGN